MSRTILVRNRQRARKLDVRCLRRIVDGFLETFAPKKQCELGIHFVDRSAIQKLNETWLRHEGPTDVITFDYNDPRQPEVLSGDMLICVSEAVRQAKEFGTSWQSEVIRYVVHGLLHLSGFDDRSARERRRMKKQEDRIMEALVKEFDLATIGR